MRIPMVDFKVAYSIPREIVDGEEGWVNTGLNPEVLKIPKVLDYLAKNRPRQEVVVSFVPKKAKYYFFDPKDKKLAELLIVILFVTLFVMGIAWWKNAF